MNKFCSNLFKTCQINVLVSFIFEFPLLCKNIYQTGYVFAEPKVILNSMSGIENEYDHIVIGGGSSECVAAARLVSEGKRHLLLLEAGNSHHHQLLDMPPRIFKLINGSK